MSNTSLTGQVITNEALDVLHQRLTFVGSTNLQYDDRFKMNGAKAGDTLQIRLPSEYTVRSGRTINVQDNVQTKVDLTFAYQKGVDVEFTSEELALDINDFRELVLMPQMSALASVVEAHYLQTVTKEVYQMVDDDGVAIDFDTILAAKEKLDNALAPDDEKRTALLSPRATRKLVDANKTLFHDPKQISSQYRDGVMGHAVGFDFAWSTHVLDHTTGTAVEGDTLYNVNGATEDGDTITVDTGSTTLLVGDVVTFAGANRVHPETKVDTGELMQFVITEDSGTSATSLSISPALVVSGGGQNVTGYPTNAGAVSKIGAGNGEKINGNLAYHKNAFAFVTADLKLPTGNAVEAYRSQFEGLSLRLVQGYDITNDTFPSRWDILYGFKCIRPQLAVRIHADG
jgi:hypothetical protein